MAKYPCKARCSVCGNVFVKRSPASGLKCGKCRSRIDKRKSHGKKKNVRPAGMSDVRWRIEQRRQMNPEYYALLGDMVA